jgi:hypothetical protein
MDKQDVKNLIIECLDNDFYDEALELIKETLQDSIENLAKLIVKDTSKQITISMIKNWNSGALGLPSDFYTLINQDILNKINKIKSNKSIDKNIETNQIVDILNSALD